MAVNIIKNPILSHKLAHLKNKETGTKELRELIKEISVLLCYESTRNIKLQNYNLKTPICECSGVYIDENKLAFVPLIPTGIEMVDGIFDIIPNAKVGHIGVKRNNITNSNELFYFKMPADINARDVFVFDAFLYEFEIASIVVEKLKDNNVLEKNIKIIYLAASSEELNKLNFSYPETQIFTADASIKIEEYSHLLYEESYINDEFIRERKKENN